jgi:hypothetical protein
MQEAEVEENHGSRPAWAKKFARAQSPWKKAGSGDESQQW